MEQVKEERYVFAVEWFDKQADLIRNYLLTFYPGDNSIDMVSQLIIETETSQCDVNVLTVCVLCCVWLV